MDIKVVQIFANRIAEYLHCYKLETIYFVFHGGEPLLQTTTFYDQAVSILKNAVNDQAQCRFVLQTNGSLINEEWLRCFKRNKIYFSISLDGNEQAQNKHKTFDDGSSSFETITNNINAILEQPPFAKLFTGILSVIDITNNPLSSYNYLKQFEKIGYTFPHGNHKNPPPEISSSNFKENTIYSQWCIKILDDWLYGQDNDVMISNFYGIIVRLLMEYSDKSDLFDAIGGSPYFSAKTPTMILHTDGEIQEDECAYITHPNAGRIFDKKILVEDTSLVTLVESNEYVKHLLKYTQLPDGCRDCKWKKVCGGGMFAHRYSDNNTYNNPSIYCGNIYDLLSYFDYILKGKLKELYQT